MQHGQCAANPREFRSKPFDKGILLVPLGG